MRNMMKPFIVCGILIIIPTFFMGCTIMDSGYFIKPYYKPVSESMQPLPGGAGTMLVNRIEYDEPGVDHHWGTLPLRELLNLLPGLSAIPMVDLTARNCSYYVFFNLYYVSPKAGEMEEILVSELNNTGIFNEVGSTGIHGDYELKSRVDFTIDENVHLCGLGIFYGALLPEMILPFATDRFTCQAHFEVISTKDHAVVFSRDYVSETYKVVGLLSQSYDYNNIQHSARSMVLGQEIFPEVIRNFINDMKAQHWSQTPDQVSERQ
jgi:hypothetical protein